MKKRFGWAAMVLLVALSVVDSNVSARAEEQISEFDVHVGDAFIFGTSRFRLGDVSLASTGESIEVIFTGRIDVVDQGATGMGAFQHRDNSGQVVDFGTFKAKHLISFTDFGTSPALPPTSHAGKAAILIRGVDHPASNPQITSNFEATLVVDCALPGANVPPGLEEGITFDITDGLNFDEKSPTDHGNTLFVVVAED
jgi:hypothetical protein